MPRAEAKYRITADDQTARGVRSAETRLQRLGNRLRNIGTVVRGVLLAAFAALSAAVIKAQRDLSRLASSAREVGTSAEDLREIQFAAKELGVDSGRAADLVDALSDSLGDAIFDPSGEKGKLFTDVLGIDPRSLANMDDASNRVAAFATLLKRVEDQFGRATREFVEQSLVGDDFSALLDPDRFLAAIARARELGIPQGTDEAAEAAERAGNAWRQAGEVWLKILENAGFFRALETIGNVLAGAGAAINRALNRPGTQPERPPQQQGVFIPQGPMSNVEQGNRIVRAQEATAQSMRNSALLIERNLNRYGP